MTLRPSRKSPRRPAGFTLIEILVVVAILVILIGLAVAIGSNVQTKAKIKATKTLLTTLDALLFDYQQETGTTLTASAAGDPGTFIPLFAALPRTQGRIASLKQYMTPGNPNQINDAFGTPIRFVSPPGAAKQGFLSAGPDGIFQTDNPTKPSTDDIYSWDPQ